MKLSQHTLINICLILAAFAFAAAMYNSLPESVPTHWNDHGIVNGYTPKPWGVFILPLMMLGIYLMFLIVPALSPSGFRINRFIGVYWILCTVTIGFLLVMTIFALLKAQGSSVPLNRVMNAGIGVLIIVIGNFLGKVTKNFFVGIRTPWTLASDEVWFRTHRLAGISFVIAGFVVLIAAALGYGGSWIAIIIIAAALISIIYSAVIYKRIEGFKDDSTESDPPNKTVGIEKR
jgi:immunity protein, SdpI family